MNKFFLLFAFLFFCIHSFSQDIKTGSELLDLEATYTGENFNNLSGGLKRGSSYLGMANLRLGLSTDQTGLWKGGQFFINAANTHGSSPSAEFLGDFQVASNIEAGNHTYIQEFWYKQALGPVELTAGLQDVNVEFVNSEFSGYFLNSSFGIIPTISGNVPAPIFPLTALGFSFKWQVSERTTWLASVYDGCPTDFDDNPYNLNWDFRSGDGVLAFSEIQRSAAIGNLPGTYKLGFFSHNNHKITSDDPDQTQSFGDNYGFYMIADQMLWHRPDDAKRLGMFLQLGFTPPKFNINRFYAGAGLNFFGLLNKEGSDVIGLAVAHADIDEQTGSETTLELTYQCPLTKNIFIQPDIQYIINPAGYGEELDNSFAAILRFGLSF